MSATMICCPLDIGDAETAAASWRGTPRARHGYKCVECREGIPAGARYERYSMVGDGHFYNFKTCLSCVEIRDHFACGNGWLFGEVWSQLEENFFPEMKAGGPCMAGLSPEAKARLFERRMKWLEERS